MLPYTDPAQARFYEYARLLERKLPQREITDAFPVEDYVELSRYRLFKREEGEIPLGEEGAEYAVHGPTEVGAVRAIDIVKEPLSGLIQRLNELFGADLTENDALSFVQFEEDLVDNSRLAEQARANDLDHYAVGFERVFQDVAIERMLKNEDVFRKLQADEGFRRLIVEYLRPRVYERQRESSR